MVDSEFSCIKEVTKTVHIALPTACTSNEISGICDVLENWKRQYIQQLQGIVVGYKNVSLSSVRGYIKLDCPVAHYDVTATFELFYPTAGSILQGKINRVSYDHIGCLVHNAINVTIDRSHDLLEDISNFIVLDRMILFQITRLDFKRKIIRVRGKITQECIKLMKESELFNFENKELNCTPSDSSTNVENSKQRGKNNEAVNNLASEEATGDSSTSSPRKKKIKRSQSMSSEKSSDFNDNIQDSSLELQNSTDAANHIPSSKKKKKHKKSITDVLSSPPLFNESLESDMNEIKPTQPHETGFSITSAVNDFRNLNSLETHERKKLFPYPSDSNSQQLNSPNKKKLKKSKTKLSESNTVANSILHNSSLGSETLIETHELPSSVSKKKKHKKSKENSSKSSSGKSSKAKKEGSAKSKKSPKGSPKKKRKKSSSHKKSSKNNNDSLLNIKEEIPTDSSSSSISSPKSKKTSEKFNDVYEMMEALAAFEPPPEAQLLANISPSKVKKEPLDSPKKGKKRKRDSVGANSLPKKKIKTEGGILLSKSKHKEPKSRKKKKEKSKKDSKKDKKKSKNKVISSKKKGHGYKVNLKKKHKKKKDVDKIKKEIKSEP